MIKLIRFLLTTLIVFSLSTPTEATTPSEVAAEREGYAALRNLFKAISTDVQYTSIIQLIFHSPYAHGEFRADGVNLPSKPIAIDKGSLDLNVAAAGEMIKFNLPFYFVSRTDRTDFYFAWDDTWNKFSLDAIAVDTFDDKTIDEKMFAVERATVLNAQGGQQILYVELSGAKIAEYLRDDPDPDITPDDNPKPSIITTCLSNALEKTGTLEATFGLNAETGQPLMCSIDLSKLMVNVLNEFAAREEVVKLNASDIFSGLAPSSQLNLYAMFDYDAEIDKDDLKLPRKVRHAKDITEDLLSNAKIESTGTPSPATNEESQ